MEWPPEATTGITNRERQVSVYLEGNGKLWLFKGDLEWLVRSLWIQQQVKGVEAVGSDDECPDSMEADMTPEKRPQPREDAGHLHDKWADAP